MTEPAAGRNELRTVSVPEQFAPIFLKAQEYVRRYFADRTEDPEKSSIVIHGERYILVRAASMSVEFFDLVTSLYADKGPLEAVAVAKNLLFDIAHSIGRADARAFHLKMDVNDPIERLSAGPIHFSYAGWAYVEIFPESNPTPDDNYYLIYDHPFSFEADAWLRIGRRADFPVCVMNAGYSSGWCEESFGVALVAAEVECQARGDRHCRFIMAPPGRIEAHLERYLEQHGSAAREHRGSGRAQVIIPEYFQRKRMEDELRASHEQLEHRVADRTAELERANKALQAEIIERELAEDERRRVYVKLQHAQKLESLGVLAGGIAHDFNNLLVGILGNAGLALEELPADSPARQTIGDIETAALRAADLTRQLLAYAGKGQFVLRRINLEHLVEEMADLLQTAVGKAVRLEYRFARGLPPVEGDPAQLRQVVINLITNASEAIGSAGGTVRLGTGVVTADRAYLTEAQLGAGLPEGRYVFIEVEDDGVGMDAATQARIFDPFFSTKFTGRGLGLAAVLGIVRSHRGAIRLTSAPGRGTTFRVLFPGQDAFAQDAAAAGEPERARGSGTVLIVDDEAGVRDVARRILETRGLTVRTASSGAEAVRIVREAGDAIDAVLLDLTMPGMDGAETFVELQRVRPGLKVVLSSGYSQELTLPQIGQPGLAGFIQKPYLPANLVATMLRVIGAV